MIKFNEILNNNKKYKDKYHDYLINNVFNDDYELLDEENDDLESKKQEVVEHINNNDFENDPKKFYDSLNKSKHQEMLTNYSIADLSKMKLFKLVGYNIGYALKQFENNGFSEIVALHNNESDVKGIGELLMQSAINNGGKYLDHYDGFLSSLYSKLGFKEYKREMYNPKYISNPKEFEKKYGKPDIIYRKLE